MLGWKDCKFNIDLQTRAEIAEHFMNSHRSNYEPSGDFRVNMKRTKTKIRESKSGPLTLWTVLCSLKSDEHSPLLLVAIKINNPTGFMSFMCIQLWRMKSSEKYKAEFSFCGSYTLATSKTDVLFSENIKNTPFFLVSWTLNAFTHKELGYMIKSCPINVHIPVLDYGKNADKIIDDLWVEISPIL
ncbi:hypothetical protein Ocin01_18353 [Orchesella cincta]|uniref:Uncharacterized protein n=1 Tax=Orchesella cincta TaxID=48709 RepID=A0A1D2M5Y6_ORCCI|nr:hypothetical protein Ocin01_18353 [Orchesella cincta]